MWRKGDLRKLSAMNAADRILVRDVVILLALVRVALALLPVRWVFRILAPPITPPREAPANRAAEIARVRWAIMAAAARLPGTSSCLSRALAGLLVLARRGLPATLHMGVARAKSGGAAHAWLVSGQYDVSGGGDAASGFVPIAAFSVRES
ncbi:conserved hypothetical protein [Candidatus Terasakiella magnetica]|nr:conserved hypothetical protein [Candidatus Terasakiella magnetica]